jgi:small-conductance mechanosensitive channel
MDGQAGWIVERVNLFNTTVCFGTTNERATISNGSLASSRIINAARSPYAIIYVQLKVRETTFMNGILVAC